MPSPSRRELPRPEDRCRGDLERWLGGAAELPCWRSEAFAEDLPAPAPIQAGAPPVIMRAGLRQGRAPGALLR